jgi:hypothetical protein
MGRSREQMDKDHYEDFKRKMKSLATIEKWPADRKEENEEKTRIRK